MPKTNSLIWKSTTQQLSFTNVFFHWMLTSNMQARWVVPPLSFPSITPLVANILSVHEVEHLGGWITAWRAPLYYTKERGVPLLSRGTDDDTSLHVPSQIQHTQTKQKQTERTNIWTNIDTNREQTKRWIQTKTDKRRRDKSSRKMRDRQFTPSAYVVVSRPNARLREPFPEIRRSVL